MWDLVDGDAPIKAILVTEGSNMAGNDAIRFPDWQEALKKEAIPIGRRDLFRNANR